MATETRCPGPEGPGRRPLHLRVGLLRRTRDDRLVVRQPDRPGDAGARTTTPRAGPGDGVPGAARPVGVRGVRAGLGDAGAPVSTRHDPADRPGLRVPARSQAVGRVALGPRPG